MQTNVLYEKIGRVALLTLNRPEKLNALDYATNDRLLSLLDEVEADCLEQMGRPPERMVNHVRRIYEPFSLAEISDQIASLISDLLGS